MSLQDDLKPSNKVPHQTCSLKWILEQIDEGSASLITEAVNDSAVNAEQIATAIKNNLNLPISGSCIRRHRRGQCRCK
jgi:hypothetical protein